MTGTSMQEVQTHLTKREREVLVLTSAGFTSKEVALQIELAPRTVERHLENARHKLGARNRAHLIVKAMEAGVLEAAVGSNTSDVDGGVVDAP